jgi:hypothetical protein
MMGDPGGLDMGGYGMGENSSDRNDIEETDEARTIMAIAKALREEFGLSIDAHPGGLDSEAGVVNRAFRVVVRSLLARIGDPEDVAIRADWVLRRLALARLMEHGVEGQRAEQWIDSEPELGDRWLTYVALAPQSVVVDVMHDPRATE